MFRDPNFSRKAHPKMKIYGSTGTRGKHTSMQRIFLNRTSLQPCALLIEMWGTLTQRLKSMNVEDNLETCAMTRIMGELN